MSIGTGNFPIPTNKEWEDYLAALRENDNMRGAMEAQIRMADAKTALERAGRVWTESKYDNDELAARLGLPQSLLNPSGPPRSDK